MDNRLLDLMERMAEWREARLPNCKGRIPADIWAEAVELAYIEGLATVSKALKLDYASLKKKMVDLPAKPTMRPAIGGGFVELISPFSDLGECVVEVQSPRGARLKIQMNGATSSGLAALIREFST